MIEMPRKLCSACRVYCRALSQFKLERGICDACVINSEIDLLRQEHESHTYRYDIFGAINPDLGYYSSFASCSDLTTPAQFYRYRRGFGCEHLHLGRWLADIEFLYDRHVIDYGPARSFSTLEHIHPMGTQQQFRQANREEAENQIKLKYKILLEEKERVDALSKYLGIKEKV